VFHLLGATWAMKNFARSDAQATKMGIMEGADILLLSDWHHPNACRLDIPKWQHFFAPFPLPKNYNPYRESYGTSEKVGDLISAMREMFMMSDKEFVRAHKNTAAAAVGRSNE
jgi:hypothetical protein